MSPLLVTMGNKIVETLPQHLPPIVGELFFFPTGSSGADLGGGCKGCAPPPPDDLRFSNTTGILQKKLCGLLVLK